MWKSGLNLQSLPLLWSLLETGYQQGTLQMGHLTAHQDVLLPKSKKTYQEFASFFFMKVKVAQSCPTLFNPVDYPVHGILQARILEWVAFPFSRGSSQHREKTQGSTLQAGFLLAEPQGKPIFHGSW